MYINKKKNYVIYFILYFFINIPFVVMPSSKIFSQVEIVSGQMFFLILFK